MGTAIALITTLGLVLVFGVSLKRKPQTSVAQTEGVYVVALSGAKSYPGRQR